MKSIAFLVLLECLLLTYSSIRYIKPDNEPSSSCPQQPCKTLARFQQSSHTFFTSGSTFIFLPGRYYVQSSIKLLRISNITLRALDSETSAIIVCKNQQTIRIQGVTNLSIHGLTFNLAEKQGHGMALFVYMSKEVVISNCIFMGNPADDSNTTARALYSVSSTVTIVESFFENNKGIWGSDDISGDSETHNGGAVNAFKGRITLVNNHFTHNSADFSGGALSCVSCSIVVMGNNTFENNSALNRYNISTRVEAYSSGGAIAVRHGSVITLSGTTIFTKNMAEDGGAVYLFESEAILEEGVVVFSNNSAAYGGGMSVNTSSLVTTSVLYLSFSFNFAENFGGGLYVRHIALPKIVDVSSATFTRNRAECGSAIYILAQEITLRMTNISNNAGSAVCVSGARLNFTGTTRIDGNVGTNGGGISSTDSILTFTGATSFAGNYAQSGGAIYAIQGKILFETRSVLFEGNRADTNGGAIYAVGSSIEFNIYPALLSLISNSAHNGGAIYLSTIAKLTLPTGTKLYTANNSASEYGGAFYIQDNPTLLQCSFNANMENDSGKQFLSLPQCLLGYTFVEENKVDSQSNTAIKDGNFLYGGFLDKCKPTGWTVKGPDTEYDHLMRFLTKDTSRNSTAKSVSSDAYELHFCNSSREVYDKSVRSKSIAVHRGERLLLYLVVLVQGGASISSRVSAVTEKSRVLVQQGTQILPGGCSALTYNLYSSESHDQLTLYPDGPCRDSGLAKLAINVTFMPCPHGFSQLEEMCVCDERLQQYSVECKINDGIKIVKSSGSNFWMSVMKLENGSYGGLILYHRCPTAYCKMQAISLTLENLDAQCDLNRSGVLCGQCASNYSLMLGGSHCEICSNHYLALVLAFAAAGLALVAFLTVLKLTVATGSLNSLILYANIVQANKSLFFPPNQQVNILSVFIAWLNLDLGIKACFFNGLTAYAQTWLQFVFPVYVWVLIGSIITVARYSVLLSRVIGSDPIAVLATLLLMSYTKLLQIIIEVYSFVDLDYPKEEKVRLKDGNVPYLSSSHLVLTVVTSLVLILFFLPYTLLLVLGHRLYPFTGRKHFRWFSRIKPLLESYYAPYKTSTRSWTGFLLLVRCALYIVFSFNSLGGTRQSLLAIIVTFTALAILGSGRIYKHNIINIVEMFVYFNLVILSTATLAEFNYPWLVYFLVVSVLALMACAIVYQIHFLYIAKAACWIRVKAKLSPFFQRSTIPPQVESPLPNPSFDPHKIVSKSVLELREPLLET